MGWFFSPLWSPRSNTRSRFGGGGKGDQVEAWLDDHSDFTRAYFLRRASTLKPLASSLRAPEWMDRSSPDILGSHSPCSPCSPRSSRCSFFSNRPLSPVWLCCPDLPHSPHPLCPTTTNTAACGNGECCPWLLELLRGGLSWMGSVAELCQGAVLHTGELLAADCCSLSLVKKDCVGRNTLEEVIAPTALGCLSEGNLCSHAHLELVKSIMGCVLATGSPVNLRDVSEVNLQSDTIVVVLMTLVLTNSCLPAIHFSNSKIESNFIDQVLSNHMDVLGMVLDNVQLYESSRQEAKRSQVLSMEHRSFEILLSKMAATIMPFTRAQYCTIFIPSQQTSVSFSRVIHLECEELGSTCQIYRSSEESIKSLICCPVRNERSENVIAVCQLMNKKSRDSDEMEAFNRYDERLLEDLSVYCGLALQYAQAVQITEERRASIEVTQEVLAYHITAAESEVQALQEATIPSVESLNILDFHFSDFGLPEDLTTQATIRMFLDLNLVQDFNIDYKSLCQWVLTVRRGYRNSVPYHNWNHALSTAQSMFAMLKATDELQVSVSCLRLQYVCVCSCACMIALTTKTLMCKGNKSQQPLAQLYGHSSLENHHYNLCLFILNNTGSQILSGLSAEDHRTVLHMIKRAILSTDLTVYMERRTEFFSLAKKSRVNWKSEKQKDLLRSMLMTASDLSAITKPWPEQKRIAKLVTMEFFAQGDKEKKEFKIKPIDIMNREKSTRLPYMQVEYIDDICYPLYKVLFNTCSPLLKGCKKNRENWMHLTEKADEEDCENSSCVALETHKNNEEKTQTEE
uniref:PDEase domain-containing protein n=1 Tax=Sander lucioperca TaxID=283035 RepID=A0A8D0ALR6_SANLU